MRKWEDIIKDKLEEQGSALPESVFAEFQARRDATAPVPAARHFNLLWAAVPAVAAGLAAILLLRHPSVPVDNGVQIIPQPVNPVAVVNDQNESPGQVPVEPQAVKSPMPKVARQTVADSWQPEVVDDIVLTEVEEKADTTVLAKVQDSAPAPAMTSPIIPDNVSPQKVKMKILPAAGLLAGGGLLAAVMTPLANPHASEVSADALQSMADINHETSYAHNASDPGENLKNELTGEYRHSFPLRGGLSVGIPIADRLKVTTGLEYILYQSWFTYSLSGEKKQVAQYLGIPLRLDWSLARNKWLDIYVGGGFEGDYCIAASLAGNRIRRDGFNISMMGAGGIQFNPTRRFGFYVEPELIWTVPSENRVLLTYRCENPFMFSVATGLRVNLGK